MKFSIALVLCSISAASAQCTEGLTCSFTQSPPTLDADLSDWEGIETLDTPLKTQTAIDYMADASFKCQYDNDKIYLAMSIPGLYRFDPENNRKCASIGTMMKIGADATFENMGGCADAMDGCADDGSIPPTCEAHLVDLGAHWELKTTERGVKYGVNEGTGNDEVANKDDEFAVSPYCRPDDNDDEAANEWEGAWTHTEPTVGEMGDYIFELSRDLKTASSFSDRQLEPGETVEFGIAFWDPFEDTTNETASIGWSKAGHFLTGCGTDWIELTLNETGYVEKPTPESAAMPWKSGMTLFLVTVAAFVLY